MDVESQERFNNKTSNSNPSHLSYSRDKKKLEERSSLFNLSVPLTHQNLNQFIASFEKTKSHETQIEFLNTLLKASPDVIENFTESRGLGHIARLLSSAARELPEKNDIVDKILSYLNKINLDKDMLTKTRIHQAVDQVKTQQNASEEIQRTAFKLSVKWKNTVEEWLAEDGERLARKYEREQRLARTYPKRATRTDSLLRKGGSSSRSEDKSPTEKTDKKSRGRPMSGSRRSGGSFGGDSYLRKRRNHEAYDDDENDSEIYSDERSDYDNSDRKSVRWEDDSSLLAIKYFRKDDEPSHPGLSEEEVKKIQEEMMERAKFATSLSLSPEEIKHKESLLEANSIKQKKDNEREIQHKLDAMKEAIQWYQPKSLKLPEDMVEPGKLSLEKKEHDNRISSKLPAMYFKEYQIPDHPSFDSIINKNPLADRPILIPLCNADGEEDTIVAPLQKVPDTKMVEETKTDSKKPSKPIKSILKRKQKEENLDQNKDRDDRPKQKEKKKLNVDPQIVLKLINGECVPEEQEQFAKALKEFGRADDILKNIQTIKKFLDSVQKIKAAEKTPQPTGNEPRKMIKTNEEPQPNMMRQPSFSEEFRDDHHEPQQFPYGLGPQGVQQMDGQMTSPDSKKVSYKPHNYKTVPCVFFHSPTGCSRGETCHFIHDWNYAGKETPNMRKYVRGTLLGKDENPMMMSQQDIPPTNAYSQPQPQQRISHQPNMFMNVQPQSMSYGGPSNVHMGSSHHPQQQQQHHHHHHQGQQQHQMQSHHQQQYGLSNPQHSGTPHFQSNQPSTQHHGSSRPPYGSTNRNQPHTGGNVNRPMGNQFMGGNQMGMNPNQQRQNQNFRHDNMYQGPPPNMPTNPYQQQPPHYQQHPQFNMFMGNNMNPQARPPMMNNPNTYNPMSHLNG